MDIALDPLIAPDIIASVLVGVGDERFPVLAHQVDVVGARNDRFPLDDDPFADVDVGALRRKEDVEAGERIVSIDVTRTLALLAVRQINLSSYSGYIETMTFVAEKPPPTQIIYQEVLMAPETPAATGGSP